MMLSYCCASTLGVTDCLTPFEYTEMRLLLYVPLLILILSLFPLQVVFLSQPRTAKAVFGILSRLPEIEDLALGSQALRFGFSETVKESTSDTGLVRD